jgi:hypothetical protein
VAPLLAGGVRHGHEALSEQVAAFALGPERSLAPEDEGSQLTLGMIVGRFDAITIDKGPESRGMVQDVGT